VLARQAAAGLEERRNALLHGLDPHPEIQTLTAQQPLLDADVAATQAAKHLDWSVEMACRKRGALFGNRVWLQRSLELPVFAGSRQNPLLAARHAFDGQREALLREPAQVPQSALAEDRRLRNAVERGQRIGLPRAEEKVALATAGRRGRKGSLAERIAARREKVSEPGQWHWLAIPSPV
jgi:hypothetical protein